MFIKGNLYITRRSGKNRYNSCRFCFSDMTLEATPKESPTLDNCSRFNVGALSFSKYQFFSLTEPKDLQGFASGQVPERAGLDLKVISVVILR